MSTRCGKCPAGGVCFACVDLAMARARAERIAVEGDFAVLRREYAALREAHETSLEGATLAARREQALTEELADERANCKAALALASRRKMTADSYFRAWYESKAEFGDAMGRQRERVREAEAIARQAEAREARLRNAIIRCIHEVGIDHDDECPEDDTCECEHVQALEAALAQRSTPAEEPTSCPAPESI